MAEKQKVCIIGAGFSGLAAAACLAADGFDVTVLEKNNEIGGRARKFEAGGFTFDMGPSWYWMPEVFENFYNRFGHKASDFYELVRLDPSYEVVFGKDDSLEMPADYAGLRAMFESLEPGSAANLDAFLNDAGYKYLTGMNEFVWKPGHTPLEFVEPKVISAMFRLDMLKSVTEVVDRNFRNEKLRDILKFPVLFLGATASDTPALYTLMNYADMKLGTWYPMGGMHRIVDAFVRIAEEQDVKIRTGEEVISFSYTRDRVSKVFTNKSSEDFDIVICSADYRHVDQKVLDPKYRNYSEGYWEKRTMAPSSLLFYLGLDSKLEGFRHHTLFFDRNLDIHARQIYTNPAWPDEPLFYMCTPSVTDASVAPSDRENVFLLMPLAPGLEDNEQVREKYFDIICDRILSVKGVDLRTHLVFKRSYCVNDFQKDYFAFKGNAYGLANTLMQTAFLKPKLRNRTLTNFYYTGQLTTPGPGVPPAIISGQVVAKEISKSFK